MKKVLMIMMLSIILYTNGYAAIRQAEVKVGGMVCTACVSVIKNALKEKISEIETIKDINFDKGIVTLMFKENNNLTRDQLAEQLKSALQKSTYKFEGITSIAE